MIDLDCDTDDIRDTARLVNALRDGDAHVYEQLVREASVNPGRFLGASIRLLLSVRTTGTDDPGLALHFVASNVIAAMESRAGTD